MVNFPTQIPDCDSHSSALLDFFLSYDASICSAMASPPLWNSDVAEFPLTFQQTQNNSMAYEYSHADWDSLCDHLRDVPWDGIFKPSVCAAASEFCEWLYVGNDVYIPPRKYL